MPNASKSKRLLLRLPHSLHESLKNRAKEEGVSINQLCLFLLAKGLGKRVSTELIKKACPECKGSGFINNAECDFCSGLGFVYVENKPF